VGDGGDVLAFDRGAHGAAAAGVGGDREHFAGWERGDGADGQRGGGNQAAGAGIGCAAGAGAAEGGGGFDEGAGVARGCGAGVPGVWIDAGWAGAAAVVGDAAGGNGGDAGTDSGGAAVAAEGAGAVAAVFAVRAWVDGWGEGGRVSGGGERGTVRAKCWVLSAECGVLKAEGWWIGAWLGGRGVEQS